MAWFTGIMTYGVIWWLVLFVVLPFGVRTADEAGVEPEPGHAASAPLRPMMLRKVAITTAIATVLFAIVWAVITYELIDLRGQLQ